MSSDICGKDNYARLECKDCTSTDFAVSSWSFSSVVISAVSSEISSVGSNGIAMVISADWFVSVSWELLSTSGSLSNFCWGDQLPDEQKVRADRLIRHSIPLYTSTMLVDGPASSLTVVSGTSSTNISSWHVEAVTVVIIGMYTRPAGVGFSVRVCLLSEGFSSITPALLVFLK